MHEAPDISPLIASLNPAQREAVSAPPEHRLVLAGAGSGKTRVLTHRVAWLIAAEGVSPMSILAVTFTNKAAAEMRARIEQLVDVPIRAMWVGTFHGIAHRMLRMHWKEAGLPQNFQILDADDQVRLVKRIIKNLELPEDQWPAKTVAGWISNQKEQARSTCRTRARQAAISRSASSCASTPPTRHSAIARAWSISPSCCCAPTS